MLQRWMWFLVIVACTRAELIDEEQYYNMPPLFEMDPWEQCLAGSGSLAGGVSGAGRRPAYCLGSFELLPHSNPELLQAIQVFSSNKYHFNHTRIHRGVCLSRCAELAAPASLRARFHACVDNEIRKQYGLEANLTHLEYCRGSRATPRPPAGPELAFAGCCAALLLLNLLGTAYDVMRNQDEKPNRYLVAWSLRASWARLTADHAGGDPRLSALKPVQGMKALTLLLIMLAHSVLAYHLTYLQNPIFLERASHHPLSAYFQNGTSIVHTFVMASSFLLAYNLLLHSENKPLSLRLLPRALMHRFTRILPVYVWVVGLAATWWVRAGDGPMWAPLVGGEHQRCRDKWWTQLLFVNNFVRPDEKCLIHTWFLAVDMQLYVVCAALTLGVGAVVRRALPTVCVLLAAAVTCNFCAAYFFDLRPMVTLMFPEYMRTQFAQQPSFTWLYQAAWDSAPAALLGLLAAHTHHALCSRGVQLKESAIFRFVYRLTVPCMFLWVYLGYYMKGASDPAALAAYAALDRPIFIALTATAMIGFFNQVDSLWWRFLSWRGWEVLGRMSLSVYLVHWLVALTQLAVRQHASPASIHEIGGHFLWTVFVTYWSALLLHLFVEVPCQKFLQTLVS